MSDDHVCGDCKFIDRKPHSYWGTFISCGFRLPPGIVPRFQEKVQISDEHEACDLFQSAPRPPSVEMQPVAPNPRSVRLTDG